MVVRRPGYLEGLAIFVLGVMTMAFVQACAVSKSGEESDGTITSVPSIPAEVAATLTAWPTPPPIVTRPPTATPIPVSLWTSVPPSESSAPAPGPAPEASQDNLPGTMPPPVRILIPALDLDAPVIEVGWAMILEDGVWRSEWETADHAAGHLQSSANPGEPGNMVISGHHNTKGEVFRPLSNVGLPGCPLRQGDAVLVVAEDGREFTYEIVSWDRFLEQGASAEEVRQHARYLEPTDTATLTLVTCWPYESNTHRVVIVARLVP